MLAYSTLFGRWAGWAVMPRNYVLAGSHIFNVLAQTNQLRRCLEYKVLAQPSALPLACHLLRMRCSLALLQLANGGQAAQDEVKDLAMKAVAAGAVISGCVFFSKQIQASQPHTHASPTSASPQPCQLKVRARSGGRRSHRTCLPLFSRRPLHHPSVATSD